MPEPAGMLIPPPGLGSGKFVTPWLRMHSEKARNDPPCDEAVGLCADEPQPQMATAQTVARSEATDRGCRRRRLSGEVCVVVDMIGSKGSASLGAAAAGL